MGEYIKDGKRLDGRGLYDLRPIKIIPSVIDNADGSAYLEWGRNKVVAAVYGPREVLPKHLANPYKALVRFNYRMAPFSVPERKSTKPGRREIEISKVVGEALSKAVFAERFPNSAIDIFVEIIDSNAGTRIAALTAASVALADAGIPMKDLVAGVAVGIIDGEVVVDLTKDEEDAPDAVDMPLAILPNTEEIVLLQMDGILPEEKFEKMLSIGIKKAKEVAEIERKALKKRYLG